MLLILVSKSNDYFTWQFVILLETKVVEALPIKLLKEKGQKSLLYLLYKKNETFNTIIYELIILLIK